MIKHPMLSGKAPDNLATLKYPVLWSVAGAMFSACLATPTEAIPITAEVKVEQPLVIIGYKKVVSRYWTWHGRDSKTRLEPIYGPAAIVPEPDTWKLLISGALLVAWRSQRIRSARISS
jgi:hypothetical protein